MAFKLSACALVLCIFATLALGISSIVVSANTSSPNDIIFIRHGKISIKSQGTPLKKIFDSLRQEYAVEIIGLEHKNDLPVTFSHTSESLEDLLKALLRHLGEKNFAFEFIDQKLGRISVLPGTQKEKLIQTNQGNTSKPVSQFVTVAEVQNVVEGSQADSLGVIRGDVIFEYDGVEIHNARQLVKEVDKKFSLANIEMIVMRGNAAIRFTLVGGFIGMRLQTKQITKEDYEKFKSMN